MHPPLSVHKHPDCAGLIEKLRQCHSSHPFTKFLGVCNDAKADLDACFRREKVVRRKVNLEKAKESKDKLKASRAREEAAGAPKWTEVLAAKSQSQSQAGSKGKGESGEE